MNTTAVEAPGSSAASIPAASLSSSTLATSTAGRRSPDQLGQRLCQRLRAGRVVRAVVDRERRSATTSSRPGIRVSAAAALHGGGVERVAQERRGRDVGDGEVAPLERARGAHRQPVGRLGRADEPRAALGCHPAGDGSTSGCSSAATSVPWSRTTASFSSAMSAIVGPEPARVLEPDAGEHLHLRRDHVGGVVAPAEPRLDHRHLHPARGQLVVGGGGQRLELGDAVVVLERALHQAAAPAARSTAAAKRSSDTGSSPTSIRSRNERRWGEV